MWRRILAVILVFALGFGLLVLADQQRANGVTIDGSPIQVVAHATALNYTPLNSIPGVYKAAELGADAVEIDVRFNKSNFPIIIHDDTVDSVTPSTGKVRDYWLGDLEAMNSAAFAPWNNATTYPQYNGLGTDGKPKVHLAHIYWYFYAAKQAGISTVVMDMKETPNAADADKLHDYINRPEFASLNIVFMANSLAGLDAYKGFYASEPNLEYWLIEAPTAGYIRKGDALTSRGITTYITPWWLTHPQMIDYLHAFGVRVGHYSTNSAEQDVPANWDRIAVNNGDVIISNEFVDLQTYLDSL